METTEEVVTARVTPSEKQKIKRAADVQRRSLSRWIRETARKRADRVLNGGGETDGE